jgi:hypothetical protein
MNPLTAHRKRKYLALDLAALQKESKTLLAVHMRAINKLSGEKRC